MTGNERPEYVKSFLHSAAAGAAFGLIAAVVFLQLLVPPWTPLLFTAGIILLAGLSSGLAGLGGAYFDQRLLRWGIKKPLPRMAISYSVIALATFIVTYASITAFGMLPVGADLQYYTFWGMLGGLLFGAAFALANYLVWRNKQKLLLLEMENRHLAELASREALLREAAYNLAVSEERNRMARELHDTISQGIHGIVYALRPLRATLSGNERGLEIHGHLEQTAADTLKELRRLVMELSPSPLEDHRLSEALRLHCDLFARRQQITLYLQLDYRGGLQPDQEMALYRLVQEGLANVQQHTAAAHVTVKLTGEGNNATLTVCDDGCGFDPATVKRGHGLNNMESRIRQSGGRLQIISTPGKGTEIKAQIADRGTFLLSG